MQKMMKLSDTHYILVDDESDIKDEGDIKVGDIVAEKLLTGGYELFEIHTQNDIDEVRQKKVTHSTQPLENINFVDEAEGNIIPKIKPLPLSEVKELLGKVDVEKKAVERYPIIMRTVTKIGGGTYDIDVNFSDRYSYKQGYNQALEDNKEKKYTEEDMRVAIRLATTSKYDHILEFYSEEEILKSIQSKTEWECIIDEQGKLKLI